MTPWTAAHQASLSITNSQSLLKLMSHQVGDAIQPSHPLLSTSPSAFNLSQHQDLFKCCIRWPKYWGFSFSISPSNEYAGRISFRMDWFDLLVVKVTLKSLLQHHSSKPQVFKIRVVENEFQFFCFPLFMWLLKQIEFYGASYYISSPPEPCRPSQCLQ